MSPAEEVLLAALEAALAKVVPELATGIGNLVRKAADGQPLSDDLLHLEIVASAKALGLNPAKV